MFVLSIFPFSPLFQRIKVKQLIWSLQYISFTFGWGTQKAEKDDWKDERPQSGVQVKGKKICVAQSIKKITYHSVRPPPSIPNIKSRLCLCSLSLSFRSDTPIQVTYRCVIYINVLQSSSAVWWERNKRESVCVFERESVTKREWKDSVIKRRRCKY